MTTDKEMEYDRYFQRRRKVDSTNANDTYHDGRVIPSPPNKVSKATAMSTPNPKSKAVLQQGNNSMSGNNDTKTSNSTSHSKTPMGGYGGTNMTTTTPASNTTPPANKAYIGLRHFSLLVCKKVEEKGTTTYNEVADELVRQILDDRYNSKNADATADTTNSDDTSTTTSNTTPSPRKHSQTTTPTKFDEKNIRRRVYDALNVLMAMNIIIKDKKAIMWRGLPTSLASASMILPDGSIPMQPPPQPVESQQSVQNEIQARTENIRKKRGMIQEFLLQHVCLRNLVGRNYEREQQLQKEAAIDTSTSVTKKQCTKSPSPSLDLIEPNTKGKSTSSHSSSSGTTATNTQASSKSKQQRDHDEEQSQTKKKKQQKLLSDNKIPLPFIVINTNKNAVIQCNMSRDLTDVMFDFTMPFEINDDNSILKRLQL